jgi:peptidylprolyl isomerase
LLALASCRPTSASPEAGVAQGESDAADESPDAAIGIAAPPPGAEAIAPGVTSVVLVAGSGAKASRFARARAKCECWDRGGHPLPADQVLLFGLTSDARRLDGSGRCGFALVQMNAGETRRLWLDARSDSVATTCDATLEAILAPPPTTPTDVKAPPADAKRTAAGIAYRLLAHHEVEPASEHAPSFLIDYAAWTTDGSLFAAADGAEVVLPRNEPIWDEGLRRMRPGDRMRFWVPADVQRTNAPPGMLVYDVDLRR